MSFHAGEIYSVIDKQLAALDKLENVPHFYVRKEVDIIMEGEKTKKCWLYVLPDFKEELLDEETIDDYEAGARGKEYVPRYLRINEELLSLHCSYYVPTGV